MRNFKIAVWYGFLVWVIPFVMAFLIYFLHDSQRPLFESIMTVILAVVPVYLALRYFRKAGQATSAEGWKLGLLWLAMSLILDSLFFLQGPMKMPLLDYVKDIGLSYLVIPAITVGMALANRRPPEPPAK
jgi:hypothetical protein